MTQEKPQTNEAGGGGGRLAQVALLLVGVALLGMFAILGTQHYLLNPVRPYLILYAAAFTYYAYAAARVVPRLPPSRLTLPVILGLGVLMRLAVVFAPPSLSTDMYRYVWDGRLTLHHINPYHWAPNAGPLRHLRDDSIWLPMEYKAYQTIYMPISQAVFTVGCALFRESLTGFKLIYLLFDVGVMALLARLLQALGRPPAQVIWYAWSPLPITEVALAGHQDVVGVFFLMLALLLALRPRTERLAALALVAGALTKGFALLLLPLFCRTFGRRFTLTAAAALLVLGLPLYRYLTQFLHGMKQYLNFVNVNSGLFHGLNLALTPLTHWHFVIVTYLSDAVMLGVTAWAAWRPAETYTDLLRRAFIVLAVTLLVVPTLFPWYLLWPLPFMALLGRRPSWAFVLLTGLVALVYTYYISGKPYWWTVPAEYIPFYAVLLWEWRHWRLSQRPIAPPPPVLAEQASPAAPHQVPLMGAGGTP